jgi:iron complex outermembrane receptor protein
MKSAAFKLLFTAIILGLLGVSTFAAAEEPEQPVVLPEVRVTANKQSEELQKVPQSISVIEGEQAVDAHITTINELGLRVPNLLFSTGGMQMVNLPTLRGVRSDPHNNVPSVTLYVDDVPVAVNAGYISQLYDVESIEVLRGPQGTLYGRNAEGGVIKITTRKPQKQHKGNVTLEGGSNDYARGEAALSGEVFENTLYAGGAFQYYTDGGLVKNDFDGGSTVDDKKNYSGRGTIRLTPSEDLDVTFSYGMVKYDEGTFGMYNLTGMQDKRHTNSQDPGYNLSAFNDQSLNISYDMSPEWNVTSVTTRRESNLDYAMDYDFSPMPFFEVHKYDRYLDLGQELRFSYEEDGVNAVFGAMYSRLDKKVRYNYYNMGMKHYARDTTDTYAAFGQVKIPFWEKWAITGGLRLEHYTTDFKEEDTGYSDSGSWTSLSPKLALEYSITDDNLVYTSVSRGSRAAGFDAYQGSPGNYEFDEEELWAFELGSKNTFWDGKARVNAALFYYKFNSMQLESYTNTMMGPMPSIKNVGNPTAFGGELEVAVMPLPGLELFGSTGYTHMRYDTFEDDLGDHTGNHVPYVPELTYNVGLQYRSPKGFFVRAEVLGATESYLDSTNTGYIPEHALVNAKIGWEFDKVEAYIFADNMFDKRYDYVNAFGGPYGVATEGAQFGGIISYKF